ncbi:DUF1648 domain-containing protein [Streptosporangium sp. CA-135522]|uniref:DUF1648 domain-containing protein n=1 Tax=Streptosporangium sp. CA-135522 TaxID=3240072 RepID=UPI003D89F267
MSLRGRFVSVATVWVALVAAVLAAVPLALRDRLPDPMAFHWGPSGAPDGSAPFAVALAFGVGTWLLVGGGACVAALVDSGSLRRRAGRTGLGATLGAGGLFSLAMQLAVVSANLGASDWRRAGGLSLTVLLAPAGLILGGWLGALAARPGPDEVLHRGDTDGDLLDLRPGQRTAWVSYARNGWLVAAGASLAAAGAGLLVAGAFGGDTGLRPPAAIIVVAGLAAVAVSSVRVRIAEDGLRISYGPLRLPRRHVPLAKLDRAWAEERSPREVGGWGLRGLPGATTVMIRGGECLVVRYASGARLAVSVDDAEHGAALLNTLVINAS